MAKLTMQDIGRQVHYRKGGECMAGWIADASELEDGTCTLALLFPPPAAAIIQAAIMGKAIPMPMVYARGPCGQGNGEWHEPGPACGEVPEDRKGNANRLVELHGKH